MTNYREIVTKAVISKGKRLFTTTNSVAVTNPSTVLGCWVINHNFNGTKSSDKIVINGSYDVNIWYSYDNDTKTDVIRETKSYSEIINMRQRDNTENEEVIVRSLRQPSCVKTNIEGNSIVYTIEKELGIELVGDVKVKVQINDDEDPWDEIGEEDVTAGKIEEEIDEEFIKESEVIE